MAKRNDPADVKREFRHVVNMTPARLEKWLASEESKSVGWDSGDGESVGHKSGKKIIRIKRKAAADLTNADLQHMRKVNWGHDPMTKH